MTYIPDPLFRNGLENYRKPASASAWERIESGLDRKRQKAIWFKMAAGLCLLMAASIVFWQYNQTDAAEAEVAASCLQSTVFSQQSSVNSQQFSVNSQQSTVNSQQSAVGSQQFSVSSLQSSVNSQQSSVYSKQSSVSSDQYSVNSKQYSVHSIQYSVHGNQYSVSSDQLVGSGQKSISILDEAEPIALIEQEEIIAEASPIIEPSGNTVVAKAKRTSITYTAEQVNARFMKQNISAEATPEKKNASGLQKVIDKAIELTTDGTVYGEIREKKNEWLSFTMLSNKTESNK